MAYVVGIPRPDIVYSRDVDGGPGFLIDCRSRDLIELSTETSTVLEVDRPRQAQVLALARSHGVAAAAREAELSVRLSVGESQGDERAAQGVRSLLAQLAIAEWLESQGGPS